MIGIVLVTMLIVAARVLGHIYTDEPLAVVWRRFAPWFWIALSVMATTGLILSISEPIRQVSAMSFWIKMTLILIGVSSGIYFGRAVAKAGGQAGEPGGGARFAAMFTILLWLTVAFMGRSIAYDVELWESWHLG